MYYDQDSPENQLKKTLKITKENVQSFFLEFPNDLKLDTGINYELFFQVFDNNAVNGNKKVLSRKFSYKQKTDNEIEEELLKEQEEYLENIENSLAKKQQNKEAIEKIQFELQNKKDMNWNDTKRIKKLIERQKQYKEMMQKQTEQLQQNLSEKKEENKSLAQKKKKFKRE